MKKSSHNNDENSMKGNSLNFINFYSNNRIQ
jgi:hypothetical protein